jgi:RHH-type proline utilization regulon transcriptional repressor/proline dehydrogenase/delta 1-pyrroline-5-carboxylate dehydrogenase
VIDLLENLCRTTGRHMMIRLVKGAYWDSEIKRSQMSGFADYPVYTRKLATDVSYLACARQLLESSHIYPSFGSHNAWTLSSILALAKPGQAFEVQRLHGMGIELHDQIVAAGIPSRIYAPVGGHQDLLAYLVRRILENGANSSFVYRLRDPHVPIASLVHDPVVELSDFTSKRNPAIPLPPDLFKPARRNSAGVDIDSRPVREQLLAELAKQPVSVGTVAEVTAQEVDHALDLAVKAQSGWAGQSVESRVRCLERVADLFEQNRAEFVALIGREAGRIIKNALAEVREAVDLCRYYAALARHDLAPTTLPGYTGETNSLRLVPRGCVAAISPWNFPLAIFAGQVAAALVSGNVVMAKPAEQTPYIAKRAVQLFHEAGVPKEVLVFLPGRGETVGAQLVSDPRIGAVVFTGSTEVGRLINQSLAHRPGPLVPIIAETGGLNAMIADSTALPEQVADDVILSAFDSAGQRCSSLRVLFVQEDVADKMTDMIAGAMAELRLGDPLCLETDIGPVIDSSAKETLEAHIMRMKVEGELLYATPLPESCENGLFVAPHLFEIPDMNILKREAFGPVLHVVRWQKDRLDTVVGSIAASGYGLTCGIHSRSEGFVRQLVARLPVGNLYVNRNMIGAIPGVQPFGGEGLSGTGPKAGGPHYLRRFCTERCVTRDTTAAGGNASLLMLEE